MSKDEELRKYAELNRRKVDRDLLLKLLSESKARGETHLFVIAHVDGHEEFLGIRKDQDAGKVYNEWYGLDRPWKERAGEPLVQKIIAVYNHGLDHVMQVDLRWVKPYFLDAELKIEARLSNESHEKYLRWLDDAMEKAIAESPDPERARARGGVPTGAIGGRFSWRLCSTTIGMIVICEDGRTGESIDLSED